MKDFFEQMDELLNSMGRKSIFSEDYKEETEKESLQKKKKKLTIMDNQNDGKKVLKLKRTK